MNDIKYRHYNDIIVADANDLIEYIDKKTPTPNGLYHHSIIIMDMRSVEYLYFELWTSNNKVLDIEDILNCPYLVEGDFKLSLNALYFNATEPTFKPALISSYGNGFNVTLDFDNTKQWNKDSLAMRQDIVKRLW